MEDFIDNETKPNILDFEIEKLRHELAYMTMERDLYKKHLADREEMLDKLIEQITGGKNERT